MNMDHAALRALGFPDEACAAIERAARSLDTSAGLSAHIAACADAYRAHGTLDYEAAADTAGQLARDAGQDYEMGVLLFFAALLPAAREFYRAEGYDSALYIASFSDLAMKAIECRKVYGRWGLSTAWFGRFFDRTRFLLERLEFEDYKLRYDFGDFRAGANAINVHIPELGPLDYDACRRSYERAVQFFPNCVQDGKALFVCSSWLLAPELRSFLPSGSNILRFAADYEILHVREEQGFPDGWRVFGAHFADPPERLPRDTALRRGYADWLCTHDTTTVGYGAMLFEVKKK